MLKLFSLLLINAILAQAQTILYVDHTGTDLDTCGSEQSPCATLRKALSFAIDDTEIIIKPGRYEETQLIVDGINYLTIRAETPGTVILDASKKITQAWTNTEGNVWSTTPNFPMWQLFNNNEPQSSKMVGLARFPNAKPWSDQMWDRYQWREQDGQRSTKGKLFDKKRDCQDDTESLKGSGKSFKDCIATLNVGHWESTTSFVKHKAGNGFFNYDLDRKWFFTDKAHYMIECLSALDAPNEFGIDFSDPDASPVVYAWLENNENPNDFEMRGKTADWIMKVRASTHFELKDVTLFAGGLYFNEVVSSTVENVIFDHSSFNKRALGHKERAPGAFVISRTTQDENVATNNKVINCEFKYTDGAALELINQNGNEIDNNLFSNIDYSAAYATGAIDFITSRGTRFTRNEVDTTGSSETLRVGKASYIAYNYFRNGGLLQEDGACVQVPISSQEDTELYRNWAEDSGKLGFRFDTPHMNANMGAHGKMIENVAFNNRRGLSVKADDHEIARNTAIMNTWWGRNDLIVYTDNLGNSANGVYNLRTDTEYNLAGTLSGATAGYTPLNRPGDNFNGYKANVASPGEVQNELIDAFNSDYRPKPNSAACGYGAYICGDSKYWIPGRQAKHRASFPLPKNGADKVSIAGSLKWQEPETASTYKIYVYDEQKQTRIYPADEATYQGQDSNILDLPANALVAGETYYWRVDTQFENGNWWKFTVESAPFVYKENDCDNQVAGGQSFTKAEIVSELDELRKTLNKGSAWNSYCKHSEVRKFFKQQSSFLSKYKMQEKCTNAKCAREKMRGTPQCDLMDLAQSELGVKPWLGHVAADLNTENCYGPSAPSCAAPSYTPLNTLPSTEGRKTKKWKECNADILFTEIRELIPVLASKKAFSPNERKYCTNPGVRAFYDSTSMLKSRFCSDDEVMEQGHVVRTPWFIEKVVLDMRNCRRTTHV